MKVEEPGPDNPHKNAFYAEETLLRSEGQAQRDCNALSHRHWIVSFFSPSFVFAINGQFELFATHVYIYRQNQI